MLNNVGATIPSGNYYLSDNLTAGTALTISSGTVNLCLNGKILDLATYNVKVDFNAALNIYDCASTKGKVTSSFSYYDEVNDVDGDIRGVVHNLGTLTVKGATIENVATQSSIGVFNGSKATVTDSIISGKTAIINLTSGSDLSVSNSTLNGIDRGLDTENVGSKATISNSTINASASASSAIYFAGGTVNLVGDITLGGVGEDIYIYYLSNSPGVLNVENLTKVDQTVSVRVNYYPVDSVVITNGAAKASWFTVYMDTDSKNYGLLVGEGTNANDLILHKHTYDQEVEAADYKKSDATCTTLTLYYKSCECGKKGTETFEMGSVIAHDYTNNNTCVCGLHSHDGGTNTIAKWESTNSLPTAEGSYSLSSDVTLNNSWGVESDVSITICLNGHTVNVNGFNFTINNGADIVINNCSTDGGISGAFIMIGSGSSLELNGVTVTCENSLSVSAIQNSGGLIIKNSKITCNAKAVINNSGTLDISGTSEVSGSNATEGNAYTIQNSSIVNILGGTISSVGACTIYSTGGTVNISGGTVKSTASSAILNSGGVVNMSGGTIDGNVYGIENTGVARLYISGTPIINGGDNKADVKIGGYASFFAKDNSEANSYSGTDTISIDVGNIADNAVIVQQGTSTNKDKFIVTKSGYILIFGTEANANNLILHKHSYSTESNVTHHWTECSCGDTTAEIGHIYDQEIVNDTYKKDNATCTTKAVYYKSCECGAFDNGTTAATFETGDSLGHDHGEWTEEVAATCTTTGTKGHYACVRTGCGKKFDAEYVEISDLTIAALNHDFSTEWSDDGANHYHACSRCSEKDSLGAHAYTEWVESSVSGIGYTTKESTCSCGKTITVKSHLSNKGDMGGLVEEGKALGKDLTLRIEKDLSKLNEQDMSKVKETAGDKKLSFLDITVSDGASNLSSIANVLEIVVEFDFSGKTNLSVYRNHGGAVGAFTALTAKAAAGSFADGTFFADTENGLIYIYTNQFSTYAIGYDAAAAQAPAEPEAPEADGGAGNNAATPDVKKDGLTATEIAVICICSVIFVGVLLAVIFIIKNNKDELKR